MHLLPTAPRLSHPLSAAYGLPKAAIAANGSPGRAIVDDAAGAYPHLYATPAATCRRFTGGGGVTEPAAEEQLAEEQASEDTALAELAAELEAEDAEEEAAVAAAAAAAAWMDVKEAATVVELV